MAAEGLDLVVTSSGGLGPTADDLTAEVVGEFQGRPMVLDEALEERIAEILRPLVRRWPDLDMQAVRASNRKQAVIPAGSRHPRRRWPRGAARRGWSCRRGRVRRGAKVRRWGRAHRRRGAHHRWRVDRAEESKSCRKEAPPRAGMHGPA